MICGEKFLKVRLTAPLDIEDRSILKKSMVNSVNPYDFDIINELEEGGYIRQGSHRSKSIVITEEGMKLSRELLAKYDILDWK